MSSLIRTFLCFLRMLGAFGTATNRADSAASLDPAATSVICIRVPRPRYGFDDGIQTPYAIVGESVSIRDCLLAKYASKASWFLCLPVSGRSTKATPSIIAVKPISTSRSLLPMTLYVSQPSTTIQSNINTSSAFHCGLRCCSM